MKCWLSGVLVGAIVGGIVGTIASDEIYDMKNIMMKKGKKIAKKCNWL